MSNYKWNPFSGELDAINAGGGIVYISGNESTDGSWRMRVDGSSLLAEYREGGVWNVKGSFDA